PLLNGSTGQHLFLYDPRSTYSYQLTDRLHGTSAHGRTNGNTIFSFDSDEDLTQTGIQGRQVYLMNVFGSIPTAGLGTQTFRMMPGDANGGGTQVEFKTREGTWTTPVGTGQIKIQVGSRN